MNYKSMSLEVLLLRREVLLNETKQLKDINKRIKEEVLKLDGSKFRNNKYDCTVSHSKRFKCKGKNVKKLIEKLTDKNLEASKRLEEDFCYSKVEASSDLVKIALKNGIIKENEFYEQEESSRLTVTKIDLENEDNLL